MNSDERNVLHRCFAKTKDLFTRKNQSEDWSHNLIEGSKGLRTPSQWKHYYAWLANPNNYNEDEVASLKIDNSLTEIEPYDSCMVVETFENGPCETIINVKNRTLYGKQDDEKTEA